MKKALLLGLAILILTAFSGCIDNNNDNGDIMNTWFAYYLSGNSIKARTAPVIRTGGEVNIPRDADWTDRGVVLSAGGSGSWDKRLTGALSPCTVVKKNGTYFLYYIGADGNRSTDGGPRHRALGVATSSDGLHFTKRGRILTYLPHNNEEEGIFSAGAFLDANGEIVMYYSALDAGSRTSTTVDSDVRLAVSSNGLNFADKGDVISHADSKVWGYGDELFPVGAFRQGSTYYVYYIAKGHGAYWDLALAWGPGRGSVGNNTKKVLEVGSDYAKSGCPVRLSANKIAVSICRNKVTQIRTAPIGSPGALSSPVQTYSTRTGGVYLDVAPEEWEEIAALLGEWGEWSENLLTNPSAESGWTGWAKDESGGPIRIFCDWPTISGAAGPCHFGYMGPTPRNNAVSRAWQDVDISGKAEAIDKGSVGVRAGGWRGAWAEVKDKNRLIIQYLTSGGGVITSYDTGWLGGGATATWSKYEDIRVLPPGCRKIRVQMQWTTPRAGEHSSCRWDEMFIQYRVRETFTPKTTTCACGAKIAYQASSAIAKNVALTCPYDGLSLGVKGVKETVTITNIDAMAAKLTSEIVTLDNRIAELQRQLEVLRDEFARTKEILGV